MRPVVGLDVSPSCVPALSTAILRHDVDKKNVGWMCLFGRKATNGPIALPGAREVSNDHLRLGSA